jgi:hypothetical protein
MDQPLSVRIAQLEAAHAAGQDLTADLELIRQFLRRAQGKLDRAYKMKGALSPAVRRATTVPVATSTANALST